jgi:hypothetical protein
MRMRERNDPPAPLALGTMLRFGRNGSARAAQWYGWTRSDQYLDWCLGAEAALVFASPDTKRPVLVEIDVLPYTTGRLVAQRLQIVCNGEPVFQASLKKRDKIQFELPPRLWQGKSRLELRFLTPDFVFPRLIKEGAEDYRPLSVAVGWIKFSIAGAEQQAVRAPFLPVGGWVDAAPLTTAVSSAGEWRELPDGIVRMVRKLAHLNLSVLEPSAGDHLLTVEFVPESEPSLVEVKVGNSNVRLDLSRRWRADILLGRGAIQKTGHLTVTVATNVILGSNRRGLPGDSPAAVCSGFACSCPTMFLGCRFSRAAPSWTSGREGMANSIFSAGGIPPAPRA